jgi:hypothetical protein
MSQNGADGQPERDREIITSQTLDGDCPADLVLGRGTLGQRGAEPRRYVLADSTSGLS